MGGLAGKENNNAACAIGLVTCQSFVEVSNLLAKMGPSVRLLEGSQVGGDAGGAMLTLGSQLWTAESFGSSVNNRSSLSYCPTCRHFNLLARQLRHPICAL